MFVSENILSIPIVWDCSEGRYSSYMLYFLKGGCI